MFSTGISQTPDLAVLCHDGQERRRRAHGRAGLVAIDKVHEAARRPGSV